MKRLLFISSLDISGDRVKTDGVTKKIILEIKTFEKLGFIVDYIFINNEKCRLYLNPNKYIDLCSNQHRYYKNIERIYKILPEHISDIRYDNVYLRFEGMSLGLNKFIRLLKKKNEGIVVNAEIPTIQRRWEPSTNFWGKIKFIIRKILNETLSYPIDHIVTFDNQDVIFGRPTIKIENFADVNNLPLKCFSKKDNDIHVVGIAKMTPSHGFDRFIYGLRKYYDSNPNKKVIFHIIGDGYVQKEWEQLTKSLKLDTVVVFEGSKTTEEITDYIDKADLAVGSLAFFRKKTIKASELKIREYCARGIPFIYSAEEPMLDGQNWCLKVPFDESPVVIEDIIRFIDNIDYSSVSLEMRKFALDKCTPKSQLKFTV